MVSTPTKPKVQLEVFELESGEHKYQALEINLVEPKDLISVSEMQMLEIPPELNLQREIILYGVAPNWLYGNLIWRFYNVPWVASFDIRSKTAVVVSSCTSSIEPGDIIPINTNRTPSLAIFICGAPDSGKSILSHALRRSLPAIRPDIKILLHRANWDGEGNHTLENPDTDLAKKLKDKNKSRIHKLPNADELLEKYFQYHAKAVENIREVVDISLVDVGGMAEECKNPVIEQCSHYIVISRYPEKIQEWHELCKDKLQPLAVIHSVWEDKVEVLHTQPYLEIIAGKWEKGVQVPDALLNEILKLL
ncbi:MAG: CRISPR-associated protein Csx3 [Calothrix sp. C42_A2020_038]|nr:CRISPR-associated protein Csx3 [Calothrix sp. C42_A2020_038]